MARTCTKVEEGTVVVAAEVDAEGRLISDETAYLPNRTFIDGDNTVVVTLSYDEAFRKLMNSSPCELRRLLEKAGIVRGKIRADKAKADE